MPISLITHFVLVDFENVPGIDLSVLGKHPMSVTLFLGSKSKLKPALVEQITALPFEVRLIKVGQTKKNALDFLLAYHLGEMVTRYPRGHYYIISGDQDFEPLITHLQEHNLHVSRHGTLASLPFLAPAKPAAPTPKTEPAKSAPATQPATPTVVTLKKSGLSRPSFPVKTSAPAKPVAAAKPTAAPKAPAKSTTADTRFEKLLKLLTGGLRQRPKKHAGLLAYINTAFGGKLTAEEQQGKLEELIRRGILFLDANGKVTYAPAR